LILCAGATGFIGRRLVRSLAARGKRVVVLSRNPEAAARLFGPGLTVVPWDGKTPRGWERHVEAASAVINLAGDSLSQGRWTEAKRVRILESRTDAGRAVSEAIRAARSRPRVLVQASAVGFYGSRGDEELPETSPAGSGFLSDVCRRWEASTEDVEALGVRRVVLRSGIVLGPDGGALPPMALPFRFFVGGPVGGGRQWLAWIHQEDEVRAILFLLDEEGASGAYNLTAPGVVRQRDFARAMGRALKRPHFFPVPVFVMRLVFGRKADETVLVSQRVRPARLLQAGFAFEYPEIGPALEKIFSAS
jgi:uncharacterized protein (TIGR01777 family)